jgi:hypothetical protein
LRPREGLQMTVKPAKPAAARKRGGKAAVEREQVGV